MSPLAWAAWAEGCRAPGTGRSREAHRQTAFAVFCWSADAPVGGQHLRASITLGEEFAYLAPGDIIGVHLDNGRVRTLLLGARRVITRSSRPSACNHYSPDVLTASRRT